MDTKENLPVGHADSLAAGQARNNAPSRVSSEALFGPARVLIIQHGDREYHLRLTQNGKLILTA